MRPFISVILSLLLAFAVNTAAAQELLAQERHPNGRLKSTLFRSGMEVRFITYFESGRVHEMGGYVEGRRNGLWRQFAENGVEVARAEFDRGLRTGIWELRDPLSGRLGRLRYRNGRLVDGRQFDEAGVLLAARTY